MTPTHIKAALSELGGGANKSLGQHFLIDTAALEAIVTSANIQPGDRVLEVGPGLGVLTRALLDKEANVTAIEQDRRMVEYLTRNQNKQLQVVHGDAAAIHWHTLIGEGNWKFVANLPYSITSLALRKALWAPHPPDVAVVLIQREVAERAIFVAFDKNQKQKGKTSLLSLMVALACSSAKMVRKVPPGAFYPPPKVDSAVLQLIPMPWGERRSVWGVEPEKIMQLAKLGFAHPRKLLASNLGGKQAVEALKMLGLSERIRAEDVSPLEWSRLTQSMTP